jgi:hypothetical protein
MNRVATGLPAHLKLILTRSPNPANEGVGRPPR